MAFKIKVVERLLKLMTMTYLHKKYHLTSPVDA